MWFLNATADCGPRSAAAVGSSCNGAVQFLLSMDERALTLGPDENYETLVEQHTQSEDAPSLTE